MKNILILISTYNGEKYLEEQLKSLISQINVKIDILVRDDGSTDRTIDILNEWKNKGHLNFYVGSNLKSAKSFMELIDNATIYDYYAFCDQDDVWYDDKLKIAVDKIEKFSYEKETLYCSSLELVNTKLELIRIKIVDKTYTLGESLIRNNNVGCTMVFNKKLLETLREYKPEFIEMHDSWTFRVCLVVDGNIIIDSEHHIKYRQHESNVIGANRNIIKRFRTRFNLLFFENNESGYNTSKELLNGYNERMSESNKILLTKVVNYKKSFKDKILLIKDKNMIIGKSYQKILFVVNVLMEKF